MKICYNPKGSTAISSSTAINDDLIFDLASKKIWAKGIRMGADWADLTNVPTTFKPSAHTHSTLDINKADATTIGSNQVTFQPLYYGGDALAGKPESDTVGVGVLKLRVGEGVYGEIALTSSNHLYTRASTTLSSASWIRVCDSSDTKVTSGKGYINGTEITQVSNASTLSNWSISDIVQEYGVRINGSQDSYAKVWSGSTPAQTYVYYSITFLITPIIYGYLSSASIVTIRVNNESTTAITNMSVNELVGSLKDKIEVYYKDNTIKFFLKKTSTEAYRVRVLQSSNSVYYSTSTSKVWGTVYSNTVESPDTTWTKVSCIRIGEVKLAETANQWTTARSFTIGNTTKSVNGSANVSWSVDELGIKNRDIKINGTSIGDKTTLNLQAGSNITLANTSGNVVITARDTWRPIQVNGTGISTSTLNLANGNYIAVTNSSGKATFNLVNTSSTKNQALLTTGSSGWALTTLNIDNWNTAYSFVASISGTDTDNVINKWKEVVDFLAGMKEDDVLNSILNNKLSLYNYAANANVTAQANTGLYINTGNTVTNKPSNFTNNTFSVLNVNLGNSKYARLGINESGEAAIYNGSSWNIVLTSTNSSVVGNKITINGVSTTWTNTWRPIYIDSAGIGSYSLNLQAGDGITLTNNQGNVTITNNKVFDNLIAINQTDTTTEVPVVFGGSVAAASTSTKSYLYKQWNKFTYKPSTDLLKVGNITSGQITSSFKHKDFNGTTKPIADASKYVLSADGTYKLFTDNVIGNSCVSKVVTMAVGTDWADISGFTGGSSSFLPSNGTYIVEIYVASATNITEAYFSGIMSWYNGNTTTASTDEIVLHRAGGSYANTIYLRTKETATTSTVTGKCQVQIAANASLASTKYTFNFKQIC